MSDPLLISRNDETGEGVLRYADGSTEHVHLPSVPDLQYIDATETGAPPVDHAPREPGTPHRIVSTDPYEPIRRAPPPPAAPPGPPGHPMQYVALPPPVVHAPTAPVYTRDHPMQYVALPPSAPAAPPPAPPPEHDLDREREWGRAYVEQQQREDFLSHQDALGLPEDPSAPGRAPVPDVVRDEVPPEWLREPGVPLPPSAEQLARTDAALHGAPVAPAPQEIPPGMRGPTPEEIARGAAPDAPPALAASPTHAPHRPRTGVGPVPSPRTPVMSPEFVRDWSQPEAFDETIAGLTGQDQATRGSPGNPYDLVDRQTQIAQREAQLAGDDARRQQAAVAASEDERRAIETERRGAMQQAQDRYQRAIDRVANAQLDPNHWFRDQGAFGTISATIAVALGALGSALTGSSTNAALDGINQAIDRDLDAQRSEIDAGRQAADLQGNMLATVGDEFDDREAARQAARAAMLDQAALELQAHTADLASDEAVVNAEALRAQIEAARDTAREEALDRQSQRDLRAAQARRLGAQAARDEARAAHVGTGASHQIRITPTMWTAFQNGLDAGLSTTESAHQAFPEGSEPYNTPPSHAPIAGPERVAIEDLDSALRLVEEGVPDDVQSDIPGYGLTGMFPRLLLSSEGRNLRQTIANLRDAFGRDRTGANMPPSEIQSFNEILGSSETSSDEDLRNGLRIMRSIIRSHLTRSADQLGVTDRDVEEFGGRTVDEAAP